MYIEHQIKNTHSQIDAPFSSELDGQLCPLRGHKVYQELFF